MALPAPNLDDRTFQDLVREARAMIPRYCPEWTDHNLSDPGITLIELFAWMVDTLLYRLNKVPAKNYIKFMELLGVRLAPPKPAKANLVFRLSAPQPEAVTIPRGTEVATVRTETREAIHFTTDEDLTIVPPTLSHALKTADNGTFEDCMAALNNPDFHVAVFGEVPEENDAFYLGFDEELAALTLGLMVKCKSEGIGIDPRDPPLVWEFWDADYERWSPLGVELDSTGGLNTDGQLILHVPFSCATIEINGQNASWIRCRTIATRPGQRPYTASPKVTSIIPRSIGGTVTASNAMRVTEELLGRSNGLPGQKYSLQNVPILAREDGETIEVEDESEEQREIWREVGDFSNSGPDDPHFICDSVSGEIEFGPSIKQLSGEERRHGKIPPAGCRIYFTSYRCGGGVGGNVGKGTITVLKSSIPYVASVTNPQAAEGGTDAESMASAKMRAPRMLRARTRAVTADDFEYLALEASESVTRVKCIAAGSDSGQDLPPGAVRLVLVPSIKKSARYLPLEELALSRQMREEVQTYLDERRLLGTRLEIASPAYLPVAVEARVKGRAGIDSGQLSAEIEMKLYRYINPICGGPDGDGWPFGRAIFLPEIYSLIQGTENVDYVEEIKLVPIDPETGERRDSIAGMRVTIDSLICSAQHQITVG